VVSWIPADAIRKNEGWKKLAAVAILLGIAVAAYYYFTQCTTMSEHLSEPQIIVRARTKDGKTVLLDDFRQSYWWLRDNTPEDARIMAWWDYGYQINGVANRTTIADGNTWNLEHIALLGKALVSREEESHKIARYLADYVLVWTTRFAGMYGDDLAKMPHMANIAGSVYKEVNPRDYYMDQKGQPSPAMRESLLFRMSYQRMAEGLQPLKLFEEVYTSEHAMVRIYKVLKVAKRGPHGTYNKKLHVKN